MVFAISSWAERRSPSSSTWISALSSRSSGVRAPGLDQLPEVHGELHHGLVAGGDGCVVGRRVDQGRDGPDQWSDLLVALTGDAEQLGDHRDRERDRQLGHDVAAAPQDQVGQDRVEQRLEVRSHLLDPAGGERPADERPDAGVVRWVQQQHRGRIGRRCDGSVGRRSRAGSCRTRRDRATGAGAPPCSPGSRSARSSRRRCATWGHRCAAPRTGSTDPAARHRS